MCWRRWFSCRRWARPRPITTAHFGYLKQNFEACLRIRWPLKETRLLATKRDVLFKGLPWYMCGTYPVETAAAPLGPWPAPKTDKKLEPWAKLRVAEGWYLIVSTRIRTPTHRHRARGCGAERTPPPPQRQQRRLLHGQPAPPQGQHGPHGEGARVRVCE